MTPLKSIRAKCIDCMCGSAHEVRQCPSAKCPLWPFRFGKRPKEHESNKKKSRNINTPAQ